MVGEVVTCECAHSCCVCNSITVEAILVLVHRDSPIINSHIWTRRVDVNPVGRSRCSERIVIVEMLKIWSFAPTIASPAAVVTVAVVVALSALFCCKPSV